MKIKKITTALLIPAFFLAACSRDAVTPPKTNTSKIIAIEKFWGRVEWRDFVSSLNDKYLVELALVYGSIKPNSPGISPKGEVLDAVMALNFNSGRDAVIDHMQMDAMNAYWGKLEKAGTVFTNPGYHVEWHEIVKRACYWAGVDGISYDHKTSFQSEQALIKKLLADRWDRLSKEQRSDVINKAPELSGLSSSQKAAILTGSGGVLVATLSSTILLSGFAFYTTMSSVLCASAGALGVALPFGAYMGASSAAAILSGPLGWTIAALGVGGGVFMYFEEGDKEKVIKMVVATHLIKVRVLENK